MPHRASTGGGAAATAPSHPAMRPSFHRLVLAALGALAACAGTREQASDEPPRPDSSGWVSPRFRSHPLAGKIWSPPTGAFVDRATLDAAVAGAHHLLLGETHDNADHHLIQARLVAVATAS